jgi:MFS family permease
VPSRSADHLEAPAPKPLKTSHIVAVVAGNALEFYDFLVYSFFAIQIGRAFFPSENPYASLMLSLATFGAGFLTRPIGSFVIGAYADRVGRRPAMLLSFTLMGLAILALAVIPPYSRIGLAAPVLAIAARMVQGFSLGGEVGPSTAYLLEAAPVERRGFIVALQGASQNGAAVVGSLIGLGLAMMMSPAALNDYGWRIAFLLGVATVPFALLVRRSLPETLHAADRAAPRSPVAATLKTHARPMILGLLIIGGGTISTYVGNYMATFAQNTLHMTPAASLAASILPYPVGIGGGLLGGWLSDRLGRRPVMIWPALLYLLLILPLFRWIVAAHDPWILAIGMSILALPATMSTGAFYPAMAESLPKSIRGSGFACVYAIAIALFGGTTQLVVTWLIQVTGDPTAPAWYLAGASLVGVVARILFLESAPARVSAPAGFGEPAVGPA